MSDNEESSVDEAGTAGTTSAGVPYIHQTFTSWSEAEKVLDDYAEAKFFAWVVHKSNLITTANSRLIATGSTDLYNDELVFKNITQTCVCGGNRRINAGTGSRPHQSTWKVLCPVKIHLIASKTHLRVTEFISEHNHTCDKNFLDSLPKTRRKILQNTAVAETVTTLFKCKVKPSVVRARLREAGCGPVTQRDLANMRAEWKRQGLKGKSPLEKLVEVLIELSSIDPGCFFHIGKTEDNELAYLFIQTSSMKLAVEMFGRVLLLDHTYKINKNRMPVSVMMVMDGHGNGRSAGYAFVANEKSVTITKVLDAFVTSIGREVADKIETVVIDKDYSEVKAIRETLPNAKTQLCDFHVSKVFKTETRKEPNKEEVRKNLQDLRYCCDDQEFEDLCETLKEIASERFWRYFEQNWLNCQMAWSYRDKKESTNLGNGTNNRLENHNSKLKMMLDVNSEIYEAVEGMINIVRNKDEDVLFCMTTESVKEAYIMHSKDPIISEILNDMTKFAERLTVYEYKQPCSDDDLNKWGTTEGDCRCPHWWSYKLPCRHIMLTRRKSGAPVYNRTEIHSMWLKGDNQIPIMVDSNHEHRVFHNVVPKLMPQTWNEKYSHSLIKAKELCSIMAESGVQQYRERYQVFDDIKKIWAAGEEVCLLPILEALGIQSRSSNTNNNNNVKAIEPASQGESNLVQPNENERSDTVLLAEENGDADTLSVQNTHTTPQAICENRPTTNNDDAVTRGIEVPKVPQIPSVSSLSVPNCFCGVPCIRLTSRADSKWPGNPFFKCDTGRCKFFRTAPKNVPSVPAGKTNSALPGSFDVDSLSDDETNENLAELVRQIEADNLSPGGQEDMECGVPESNTVNESLQNKGTPRQQFVQNIQDVFKDVKLPVSVKHKGRPQGLGKTNPSYSKRTPRTSNDYGTDQDQGAPLPSLSTPRGVLLRTTPDKIGQEKARKERGLKIADGDVKREGLGWTVKSQDKKSNKTYSITRIDSACACPEDPCLHGLVCDCPDFKNRKMPCKHIVKVLDVEHNNQGINIVKQHRLSLTKTSGASPKVLPSKVVKTPAEAPKIDVVRKQLIKGTNCIACKNGDVPTGLHKCVKCDKAVHVLEGCSTSIGLAEGCGEKRMCETCNKKRSAPQPTGTPSKRTKVQEFCSVCLKDGSGVSECLLCKKQVHQDTPCSIASRSGEKRTCIACSCKICKYPLTPNHTCSCVVCKKEHATQQHCMIQCKECEQAAHEVCGSKQNEQFTCARCHFAKVVGISETAMKEIEKGMLSDVHLSMASNFLKFQFHDIKGLEAPLYVIAHEKIAESYTCVGEKFSDDCIQFMNTGRGHWVTYH